MCNDVLSTQLYFPSLTYFIHTHFSAINFRDKVAQRLFFSRDTKHTLHPSLFKHLKLRDLFEKLLEDDSRLYIFRLFYVFLLTFVYLCFEVIIQRIKTGPANLVSTNSLKFSFDKNFFSQEKCFN